MRRQGYHNSMAGEITEALPRLRTGDPAAEMGVPVVTLAGISHISRVGVSLLNAMSLPDWIAERPEDYIRIAIEKAQDLTGLANLRRSLRQRMRASPLTARGYVRALEQIYTTCLRRS